MEKFNFMMEIIESTIKNLEPEERMMVCGMILDSVVVDTGKELEDVYAALLKVAKDVEEQEGKFYV